MVDKNSKQGKTDTSRVGKTEPAPAPAPEKKKVKRIDFPIAEGKKLTEPVPAGFDLKKHNPIKKAHFDKTSQYLRHRAFLNRQKAEVITAQAVEFETKADRMEKFGDEATVKKVKKIERLQGTLTNLTKELEAAGINIQDILSAATAPAETAK